LTPAAACTMQGPFETGDEAGLYTASQLEKPEPGIVHTGK